MTRDVHPGRGGNPVAIPGTGLGALATGAAREEVLMEEHKELENRIEEAAGTRRRAAEFLGGGRRESSGTRPERTRSGSRRWVTSLRPRPDLRRFTRAFPVL